MRKSILYGVMTRLLIGCLAVFMLSICVRFAVTFARGRGVQLEGKWVELLFFDATEEEETPIEQPMVEEAASPAEPVRDRDGIIWSTKVDWAALYPPKEVQEENVGEKLAFPANAVKALAEKLKSAVETANARTADYTARVAAAEALVTGYATDDVIFYQNMVELANTYDSVLGWQIAGVESYNPVIMLEDNYFVTCVARQDRVQRAQSIADLRDFCEENGMAHLYITTPNDTCRYDEGINGVADFFNYNADRLQALLKEAKVETMDLRDDLHADGLDHHKSFYQTDHHWLPQTGLWATGKIAQKLNDIYGFSIDTSIYSADNYDYELYSEWFLGSQGKKVTLSQAKPEDFYLIYPKFETQLHIEIPSLAVDKTGDFSVMYRYGAIEPMDYYKQSPYAAYLYGDNALTHIHNEALSDGKRVLVLGHSFDNCVIPFLALGIEYVDSMDLRMFTGDLRTYLSENHYDVVIELYTE